MKSEMNITRLLLIVLLLAVCALIPSSLTHFRDYFDPTLREVNYGHYDYNLASLLWSATNLILAVAILLSIIGSAISTRVAIVIILYTPIYVLYGNYGVTPRGLHTTPLNLIGIIAAVAVIGLLLIKHLNNLKDPQHVPPVHPSGH